MGPPLDCTEAFQLATILELRHKLEDQRDMAIPDICEVLNGICLSADNYNASLLGELATSFTKIGKDDTPVAPPQMVIFGGSFMKHIDWLKLPISVINRAQSGVCLATFEQMAWVSDKMENEILGEISGNLIVVLGGFSNTFLGETYDKRSGRFALRSINDRKIRSNIRQEK